MSAARPIVRLCEDCVHGCLATYNNRSTCGQRLGQRYIWPERMGDPHGPSPRGGDCFEAKPQPKKGPRRQ